MALTYYVYIYFLTVLAREQVTDIIVTQTQGTGDWHYCDLNSVKITDTELGPGATICDDNLSWNVKYFNNRYDLSWAWRVGRPWPGWCQGKGWSLCQCPDNTQDQSEASIQVMWSLSTLRVLTTPGTGSGYLGISPALPWVTPDSALEMSHSCVNTVNEAGLSQYCLSTFLIITKTDITTLA